MPKRRWTDRELKEALAASATLGEVVRRLGLKSGSYATVRKHVDRLGLDAGHIAALRGSGTRRPRAWTDDDLAAAVASSRSLAEVMRRLGYRPSGGIHRWLSAHIRDLGISTSHFDAQAWRRGRAGLPKPLPMKAVLVQGSTYKTSLLRRRLIAEGLKEPRCEQCGLSKWRGEALPLMLDHINGDPTDHRLENLRILCPNCHALTPTWCARNRKPA